MATENEAVVQEQQQTDTQQQQQETQEAESALEAGFNEARGVEPPAEATASKDKAKTETANAEAAKSTQSSSAPETAETAEKAAQLFAGMTETEVKSLFDKVPGLEVRLNEEIRKVYGKVGELQGNLQKYQQGQSTRKFEAGALKRLNTEFPEIAQMLAEDLSEIFTTAPAAAEKQDEKPKGDDTGDIDARFQKTIDAAVANVAKATELKFLTVLHPDWEKIAKNPEFAKFETDQTGKPKLVGGWLHTLPEAERTKYSESEDAIVAAEAFTRFKQSSSPKTAKKPSAQNKQERLEAAITPSGEGAPPTNTTIDDEAALVAGWNSVR